MKKFGQVVGITFISQVVGFLNAAFSPFRGTAFAFDEWEGKASETAIAVGFLILAVIVSINFSASKTNLKKHTIVSFVVTVILFVICAVIYFVLKSGYAPTVSFVFLLRNEVWMVVYILMLIMVGITIAFAQLLLYFGGSGSGRGRGRGGSH
jgi:predicted Na+-dependent transporter